jgi:hypothetical protein
MRVIESQGKAAQPCSPRIPSRRLPTSLHNQMVINGHTIIAAIESKE